MKNPNRILLTAVSLLALLAFAGAQAPEGARGPTVVVSAAPFDASLLYVAGGVILLAIVALAIWLRTRKRGGKVIAATRDR